MNGASWAAHERGDSSFVCVVEKKDVRFSLRPRRDAVSSAARPPRRALVPSARAAAASESKHARYASSTSSRSAFRSVAAASTPYLTTRDGRVARNTARSRRESPEKSATDGSSTTTREKTCGSRARDAALR